ncbi:MAG TPA: NADH:ubiquinone reductase (Na(+)-transporting) subunit C [Bacteroidales bacterium]|nr:NADH:ubiquinone reductase (Na(+)-transporting) subunit C [Bacteroidales bacterium]
MYSNSYVFRYAAIMVIVVAAALASVAMLLKPAQDRNVTIEKMRNILAAANIEATPENAIELFDKYVVEEEALAPDGNVVAVFRGQKLEKGNIRPFEINLKEELYKHSKGQDFIIPLYIAEVNGKRLYIFPMLGRGLWGPVYGNLALEEDFNTVAGSMFGHDKETPGLGAEIELPQFESQFIGKKIFDDNGNFTSIQVLKGASEVLSPEKLIHGVDAISGGTITSNGVSDMIKTNLANYIEYIKKQKI